MTTLTQIIVTTLIIKYLGSTIVLGRPQPAEELSHKSDMNGGLHDPNAHRLKRLLRITSRDGSTAIFANEMNHRHLKRIKRDLANNPCYKHNTYMTITLSDNTVTFSVECKPSTNWGCFHNIPSLTTTMCTEKIKFFPSAGQSVVQGCKCA